jgi:hypothetical protein
MRIRRIAMSAVFATGLAALPISTANAQYYAPCSPFPLAWPFCVAGAIVGTAATIATAPFWILSGTPPYGFYAPPYYPVPSYYAPGYYAPPTGASPPTAPGGPVPLTSAPPATHSPAVGAPVPLTSAPPVTHSAAGHAPPPGSDAYYFCPASKGYYPYVASCAVAWRSVPATPPPHSSPR